MKYLNPKSKQDAVDKAASDIFKLGSGFGFASTQSKNIFSEYKHDEDVDVRRNMTTLVICDFDPFALKPEATLFDAMTALESVNAFLRCGVWHA